MANADQLLRRSEVDLEKLLRSIDRPVDGWPPARMVALGLGLRGHHLYTGFRHLLSGPSMPAAAVIVRAIVDLAILCLWVEVDPETHVECWFAEDDRQSMVAIDAFLELGKRRGRERPSPYSSPEREELQAGFVEFRKCAREAGVRLPPKGSLLPPVKEMAGEHEYAWEAYNVAYRLFSPWSHAGGRSFAGDSLEIRADGNHLKPSFPFSKIQLRGLVVPLLCILFASVSRQAGLGIEGECDRMRLELATWPVD